MYAATLEPLLMECNSAIDLAKEGDIDGARVKLDRIRYYRSVLALSQPADSSEGDSRLLSNPELVRTLAEIASKVNERLEFLHRWITEAKASFSSDELCQSMQGIHLFVDDALPGIWDFKQDLAVLTDEEGYLIREALRARGQVKFIWLTTRPLSEWREQDPSKDQDTIYLIAGEQPENIALEGMLDPQSVPRVALLTMDCSAEDEQNFHTLVRSVGSAVIAGTTTRWLPQQTVEQWLDLVPRLARLPSAMTLQPCIEGADILVVSPGPSLVNDLPLLVENSRKFIVIASVKSLGVLFKAGISPDLAIWQDPRDHSDAIPHEAALIDVPLILNEGCHPAFYKAEFATHLPYPEPGFLNTALSKALHGHDVPLLVGTSVSTLTAVMSLCMGAKSVTLLGQDLSIAGGFYVGEDADTSAQSNDNKDYLTCKGIDGDLLPTLPNYFSFIEEFQHVAAAFGEKARLINSTSKGAFLEGWQHLPFAEHPIVMDDSASDRPPISFGHQNQAERVADIRDGVREMEARLDHAARISEEIYRNCLSNIESGSNDVTVIDLLEQRLKLIFDEECQVIKYYTSRQSMALTASTASVQSLDENLRLSADYYESIGMAARKLVGLCQDAAKKLEVVMEGIESP